MKNTKLVIVIIAVIFICLIVLAIILGKYGDAIIKGDMSITEEPELIEKSEAEDITKYSKQYKDVGLGLINYFYYLSTENNEDAVSAICKNRVYKMPEVIENIELNELYVMDNNSFSVYFINLSINDAKYYYTLRISIDSMYEIEEISREKFDSIKKAMPSQYKENKIIENEYFNSLSDIKDDIILNYCFTNFIKLLKDNPQAAYAHLDTDYRTKRFENYANFEANAQIILDNIKDESFRVESDDSEIIDYDSINNNDDNDNIDSEDYFTDENVDDSIEYICLDDKDCRYILKVNNWFNYSIQLDDYTIRSEKFKKEYVRLENYMKGTKCIEAFFEMLNTQDYKSAYAVLDENFKKTYFPTQADFENYAKTKFFKYSTVSFEEYLKQMTGLYSYKISLTDSTGENENTISYNAVVKLLDGTDFIMSFSERI